MWLILIGNVLESKPRTCDLCRKKSVGIFEDPML